MTGGERAYAYAKACGIIGKSFVGRRSAALRPVSRLSELDRLVFGSSAKELPERELLPDLERRLTKRSVDSILALLSSYRDPPELLSLLIRVYEYADLKTALALSAEDNPGSAVSGSAGNTAPGSAGFPFTAIGTFGTVRFSAWPDVRAMLERTEFEFLLENGGKPGKTSGGKTSGAPGNSGLKKEFDGVSLETVLDRHYYRKLWDSICKLPPRDRRAAEKISAEEISLRNCAWMLRLRTYYGMEGDEVTRHLVTIPRNPRLSADALEALDFPLDGGMAAGSPWEKWSRAAFLDGRSAGSDFFESRDSRFRTGLSRPDPRRFQNAASGYLYRLALRSFRRNPSSLDTAFCFIKLKQFEEDLLTSSAEGLGMGMNGAEVLAALEAGS